MKYYFDSVERSNSFFLELILFFKDGKIKIFLEKINLSFLNNKLFLKEFLKDIF